MSSLAAARADNFYFPPEWDPKRGGLNKFNKSHSLGERAKKIDQGIIVIRFEMMYNVWCLGCDKHIGKGTRYNAEKSKAGKYFTTTIWEFKMKCHLCDQIFIIRTDPENRDYKFVSGVRRKVEEFTAAQNEEIELADSDTKARLEEDAFFRLEHAAEDKRKAKSKAGAIAATLAIQHRAFEDYGANAVLRRAHRAGRKELAARQRHSRKLGLGVTLLKAAPEDAAAAAKVRFGTRNKRLRNHDYDVGSGGGRSGRAVSSSSSSSASKRDLKRRRQAVSGSIFGGDGSIGLRPKLKPKPKPSSSSSSKEATTTTLIVHPRHKSSSSRSRSSGTQSRVLAAKSKAREARLKGKQRGIDVKQFRNPTAVGPTMASGVSLGQAPLLARRPKPQQRSSDSGASQSKGALAMLCTAYDDDEDED